jgi:RimJ/RimL family protein N-acetyltransferase
MVAGMKGLGLERDNELVAGVIYEGWNGVNLWMHVAAEPGKRWMTRDYLRYCFYYPFEELGCKRVSGYVEASNEVARRFDEHLGFQQEAVLKGAATDGGDVVLYVMRRENCRFLER